MLGLKLINVSKRGHKCKVLVDEFSKLDITHNEAENITKTYVINHFKQKMAKIMMTSSNGNIFRVTGPLCGEFTGPGEFPTQRPVTRSFDVFFDVRLNKRLSKQPWGWWFETPSWSLWRQCNVTKQWWQWYHVKDVTTNNAGCISSLKHLNKTSKPVHCMPM